MRSWVGTLALLISLSKSSVYGADNTKSSKSGVTKAQGPPPFFLQDPTDSLCLAGAEFRRCSIETLFFVVGTPGTFSLSLRKLARLSLLILHFVAMLMFIFLRILYVRDFNHCY